MIALVALSAAATIGTAALLPDDQVDAATAQVTATGALTTVEPQEGAPVSPARPRLLILKIEGPHTPPKTAQAINRFVSQGLARSTSLEIITMTDLGPLFRLNAAHPPASCDAPACLAEVAAAAGSRFVIFGAVDQHSDATRVQLNLFDSATAEVIGYQQTMTQSEPELSKALPAAASALVRSIVTPDDPLVASPRRASEGSEPPVPPQDNDGSLLPIALFVAGISLAAASVVVGFVGTTFFVVASSALSAPAESVPVELKNNFYGPFGPLGAIAGGLAMVGFGVGAAIATAGFFVE